jgi:hypothetical protein
MAGRTRGPARCRSRPGTAAVADTDFFTYQDTDSAGAVSNVATATINVVNEGKITVVPTSPATTNSVTETFTAGVLAPAPGTLALSWDTSTDGVLWTPTGVASSTFLPALTGPTGIFVRGTASFQNAGATVSVTSDPVYYISDKDLGGNMWGTAGNNIIFGNGGDDLIAAGIGSLDAKAAALELAIFSSVLAVLTAGGLSWIGATAQAGMPLLESGLTTSLTRERLVGTAVAHMQDELRAGATALAASGKGSGVANTIGQLVIGEVGDVVPTALAPATGAMPIDPISYQNQVVQRVLAAKMAAHETFAQLTNQLKTMPPAAWEGFDTAAQEAAHQSWIEQAGLLATNAKIPKEADMEIEFERSMWAAHYQDVPGQDPEMAKFGLHVYNEKVLQLTGIALPEGLLKALHRGDAVNQRLRLLGIANAAGMLIWGVSGGEDPRINGAGFRTHCVRLRVMMPPCSRPSITLRAAFGGALRA